MQMSDEDPFVNSPSAANSKVNVVKDILLVTQTQIKPFHDNCPRRIYRRSWLISGGFPAPWDPFTLESLAGHLQPPSHSFQQVQFSLASSAFF